MLKSHFQLLKTSLILAVLIHCTNCFGQSIAAGASYFPLKRGATYYYKASFAGNEVIGGLRIYEKRITSGEKVYYFNDPINPSSIIGAFTFGLGAYYIEKNEVYTIKAFWDTELDNITSSQKQLMIPKMIEPGQSLQWDVPGSDPRYTLIFEGYDNITVPAGVFNDCLKLKLVALYKSGTEDIYYAWFAKNTGVVRVQLNNEKIKELVKYSSREDNDVPVLPASEAVSAPIATEAPLTRDQPEELAAPAETVYSTVTDYEGNIYKTVKIGNQVWMAENLRSTKYADGTPIVDSLAGNSEYLKEVPTFGRLYSWHALLRGKTLDGSQGVCPEGWHVPMKTEWEALFQFAGGADVAGQKLKSTGTQYFKPPNTGTDAYGFNALPCGFYSPQTGFSRAWHRAHFWSSTIDNEFAAPGEYCVGFFYEMWHDVNKADEMFNMPGNYHPVRCIKD